MTTNTFWEPDLVLLDPDDEWIETVRASSPMLPAARRWQLGLTRKVKQP